MYEDEGFFGEDIDNAIRAAYHFTKGKFGKPVTAADVVCLGHEDLSMQ
jgi:hypothetical protein